MKKLLLILSLFVGIVSHAQTPNPGVIYYTTPAPGGSTAFLVSNPSTGPRNDYTGEVGMKFTVGATPLTVDSIGRWVISGNSGTHTVRIADASGATVVSASVNTSGLPVGYNYVSISPTVLSAGTDYYIFSDEVSGGDQWREEGPVTSTGDGTVVASALVFGVSIFTITTGYCYVTVNFKYHL